MKCSGVGREGSSGVTFSRWFQRSFCFSAVPETEAEKSTTWLTWPGHAGLLHSPAPSLALLLSKHRDSLCQGGTASWSWHHLVSQIQDRCSKWDLCVIVAGLFNSCCEISGPRLLPIYSLNVLVHCLDSGMKALYSITVEGKCFLMNTGNKQVQERSKLNLGPPR